MFKKITALLLVCITLLSASAEEVKLLISAAGDCTLGGNTKDSGFESFQKIFDTHGADWFLENVMGVFENDDMSIVNFEGVITASDSYKEEDKTFTFRCLPSCTDILTHSGIEVVTIANNHSHDFGLSEYKNTRSVLADSGLIPVGYTVSSTSEINGVRVTVCGFTWWQNRSKVLEQIRKLRENCDLLIVCMHWGSEGVYEVNDNAVWWGHAIIDAGADVILGSHTHLVSGIELYNGKYIVYSMGNFCFGGNFSPEDMDSFIFQEEFTFTDGTLSASAIKLIPCLISSDSEANNMQPVLAKGKDYDRILRKIRDYSPTNWNKFTWIDNEDSNN